MTLRTLYKIDGWLMLIVGLGFLGGWPVSYEWLGIDVSGPFMDNLNLWKALSFASPFGGAVMALGLASLAVSRSTDGPFLQTTSRYFLAGHIVLSFILFSKAQALWGTAAAFVLLDVVAFPGAGFLYCLIADSKSARPVADGPKGTRETSIREAASQAERTRLAQDLHDSVKQQIYSIQASLATVQARWKTDEVGARAALEQARSSSRDAMAETIALLDRLRQDPIETIGLVEALRRQCEALGYQTSAEVTTTFGTLPDGNRVPPGAMKSVFRIAQEALANVARHARAMHVQLDVGRNDADDELVLRIRDDGQGFDTSSPASGMGISNMRERAAETGARLELQSKPGEGTAVALHLPLLDPREESLRRHQRLLLAVTTPAVLLSWAAFRWPLWRPHVLPPLMLTVAVAGYQAWRLVRLQWR